MMDYVQIAEEEGEEPIELPTEEDGTLLLSTLQAQFPGACGLKYRNEETKIVRGVRSNDGRFYAPGGENGWGSNIFFCVFPKENKRKSDDNLENSTAKTKRMETRLRCTDLIVLGLPWKATEESLREYFEGYGEVLMVQVKKDNKSGQSKGFGFVRFGSYEAQMRALATRHLIDGRWCEVKVPNSKGAAVSTLPCKVFVGRCTEDLSAEDLREYFSKFGEVTDVFIPKPFRAFSFVTFLDPEVAQSLCGEDHIIKGVSVNVSNAAPKSDNGRTSQSHYNFSYNANSPGNIGSGMNSMSSQSGNNSGGGRSGYSRGGNGNNMSGDTLGPMNGSGYNGNYSGGMNGYGNGGSGNGGMRGNSGPINRQDGSNMPFRSSNYMMGSNSVGGNNSGWGNQPNRGHIDMPNLQALGINPQGPNSSNQGQNLNNPLGVGLNLNSLPMNPALVAAALNQWGLLGNQLQNQSQDHQGGNFLSWMAQASNSGNAGGLGGSGSKGGNNTNPGSGGNQGNTSSDSQLNGSSNSGNQGWSRQTNASGVPQGPGEKSNFL